MLYSFGSASLDSSQMIIFAYSAGSACGEWFDSLNLDEREMIAASFAQFLLTISRKVDCIRIRCDSKNELINELATPAFPLEVMKLDIRSLCSLFKSH